MSQAPNNNRFISRSLAIAFLAIGWGVLFLWGMRAPAADAAIYTVAVGIPEDIFAGRLDIAGDYHDVKSGLDFGQPFVVGAYQQIWLLCLVAFAIVGFFAARRISRFRWSKWMLLPQALGVALFLLHVRAVAIVRINGPFDVLLDAFLFTLFCLPLASRAWKQPVRVQESAAAQKTPGLASV
jgi:hypothetical protein